MSELKSALGNRDAAFSQLLREQTSQVESFAELLGLSTLRKRAQAAALLPKFANSPRIGVVGGCNLHPLVDLVEHFVQVLGEKNCEIWTGDYDNYTSEIMDKESQLYAFRPEIVLLLPSERRCRYRGHVSDTRAEQERAAEEIVTDLIGLCERVHGLSKAEVIISNFRLSPYFDPGPLRYTSLASDYSFRKYVNLRLGARLPSFVHVCDVEFLSNRRGNLAGVDDRTWFESKQPFAAELTVDVAREFAYLACNLRSSAKKVAVLDLDNTLWGGVVGDDGIEGIEIGTTSPRGEAFRDFQQYLLSLTERGILLAVCSKNDHEKAVEPFERHPEMVLRMKDIVCFKANWEPKSENIKQIAQELNLGVDSLVFIDDNPAEIEIVRQFVPGVSGLWVGDDPAEFVAKLKDSRFFEMRAVTAEDAERVQQYQQEAKRQELMTKATDIGSYLESLEMKGWITEFQTLDVPRIAQLINKSNQFNLTTRRRTEGEVHAVMNDPGYVTFTMRLADKFGDHGLIAIVVGKVAGRDLEIDTWLMSCRVLKRQVEEEVLNEIVRLALANGCSRVLGFYIPTAKNGMVRDLYPKMGFAALEKEGETMKYSLDAAGYVPQETKILIENTRTHGAGAGH